MNFSKKLIVEFIGTFFLVLTVGMTAAATPAGVIPPLAIGAALMVMVYAGGHISGAHYNPAVTFAVWIRGKICPGLGLGYIVAQLIGAVVAAKTVLYLKNAASSDALTVIIQKANEQSHAVHFDLSHIFLAEVLFTFALAWVVLHTATANNTKNNSFYGLAIGFTVLVGAFAVGNISGGAFNPAVVVGAALVGLISSKAIGLYVVANFVGAGIAALLFRFVNDDGDEKAAA